MLPVEVLLLTVLGEKNYFEVKLPFK